MEKFRGEQKNVTRSRDILFYKYDFEVGLLQGFMINAHESGSNSPGAGTLSRGLTKTNSMQCRDFTWALHMEKSISPLFPDPGWDVVANDWCIMFTSLMVHVILHAYKRAAKVKLSLKNVQFFQSHCCLHIQRRDLE